MNGGWRWIRTTEPYGAILQTAGFDRLHYPSKSGLGRRIRTSDILLPKQTRYQLRYTEKYDSVNLA